MRPVVLAPLVAMLLVGCADPVQERAIDALGGEAPGVPEGPMHRPGQPCTVCHSSYGPGAPEFSLAGTVYQTPDSATPLVNGLVKFIDSRGQTYQTATNCAGNFFVLSTDYDPTFPVWVKVVFGKAGGVPVEAIMGSPFFREGSCSACHGAQPGPTSVGRVYLAPAGVPFPPSPCGGP